MEIAQVEFMAKAHAAHLGDPEFQRLYDTWRETGLTARGELHCG